MNRIGKFLFLLAFLAGVLGMSVGAKAESPKRAEAVDMLREVQARATGNKYTDYENVITLIQGGHKNEASKTLNALMASEEDPVLLDRASDAYFLLGLNPKPKLGSGTYKTTIGFVYANGIKSKGTVYWWNYLRTILMKKCASTASTGYTVDLWTRLYDARASITTASGNVLYTPWKNDLLPPPVVNFFCYY